MKPVKGSETTGIIKYCFGFFLICVFGPGNVWYQQLKWGLTIHAFTQPQSISHFSSTHPQRKMLKRDILGKLNLAQRIPVTWGRWHLNTPRVPVSVRISLTNEKKKKKVLLSTGAARKCWTSSPSPAIPLNPTSLEGTMAEMSGLWSQRAGAIESLAAGSDAVN